MASTTLMPLDPALSPQRVARVLTISADLLPEEIVAGRRARRARIGVLVALGLVVLLLAGWYAHAAARKAEAGTELAEATNRVTLVQRGQARYSRVVDVQAETDTTTRRLATLLATDLPWATLLDTLRTTGSAAGVTVSGITGSLTPGVGGAASAALPRTSGDAPVGALTVTGAAPDKPSVARYVDALDGVAAVANPYVTSVTQTGSGVQFSLSVDVSSAALCGRFTTRCKTSGGN